MLHDFYKPQENQRKAASMANASLLNSFAFASALIGIYFIAMIY
jgi:hypothetical protein